MDNKKILVAYFSRKGKNYVNGDIVDLTVGNTEVIANQIQELVGGDLFKIEPVKAYPDDYNEATHVAQQEIDEDSYPELATKVTNINTYDYVFLGYPIWWGTFPAPVKTFLSQNDLSGKTIVPFCTHEGSGLGHSIANIKQLCPQSAILKGIAIRGSKVEGAKNEILSWLQDLKLME